MSRSEFRWNKKRKHYAYLFKDNDDYRKNLLLHSDPSKKPDWNEEKQKEFDKKNVELYQHPNPNKPKDEKYYVEKRVYNDHKNSFKEKVYQWKWSMHDKRKIKRLKKGRRTR